ncbi:hypothetical protein HF888_07380 [Bermanella marisrubri]|uniref:Uncharacterized protein n=1 Tax=Bermanella marisrubri TaxID=207949 RepID=Q1N4X9_9GAMM|nr:hypothetical protein [Bermanella marisrubri]EAT13299.1 hypothetical protein RED65_01025 [Oceanobacter sp. RED65] [Bermanella marisrubri]QIZ84061.1 hypothetical protein HF888_07380 [Bermanella marisrubri]
MLELDIQIYLSIAALLTSFLAGVIGQGGGMILMAILAPSIPAMAVASIIGSKLGTLSKNRLPLGPLTFVFKCVLTLLSLNMVKLGIEGLL